MTSTFSADFDSTTGKLVRGDKIRRGLVFYIHMTKSKHRKDYATTARNVLDIAQRSGIMDNEEINFDSLKSAINRDINAILAKKQNIKREACAIIKMLSEDFNLFSFRKSKKSREPCELSVPIPPVPISSGTIPVTPSPTKLKTDCSKCVKKRAALVDLSSRYKKQKLECDDLYISSSEARTLRYCHIKRGETMKSLREDRMKL